MAAYAEFPPMKNDLILRAARGEQTEKVPVWVMRQAGRYLPEFREVRAEQDFFKVCRTPELACKVTMQPIDRYELDAAIIFSDILVVPQALGMEVEMIPGKGPNFPEPLKTVDDLKKLKEHVDVDESLGYVFDAITLTRKTLAGRVPLIGFCGGPWTLMAYMVEGGGSKTFSKAKTWLFAHPNETHQLLNKIAEVSVRYLVGQVKAGAQMLQVFESWAGELSPAMFAEFSSFYLTKIYKDVQAGIAEWREEMKAQGIEIPSIPMVVFPKGANYAIAELAGVYDVVQVDWTVEPKTARALAGETTLQGNLDPCALYAPAEVITTEVEKMIAAFGTKRYIANLGHGMHPTHDPEHLRVFIDAVHSVSERLNK